ncbi:hypothetical protein KCO_07285 [Pectobacterium brasiliense ICMP 19477]|nr:hypothetical protein KCO_07285 [Pectobacterium brasiliense ICMP 19477]
MSWSERGGIGLIAAVKIVTIFGKGKRGTLLRRAAFALLTFRFKTQQAVGVADHRDGGERHSGTGHYRTE